MLLFFKQEEVNLDECPETSAIFKSRLGAEITQGDYHGNALKLLFILSQHGVWVNSNKVDYKQLVAIYKKPVHSLTPDDLNTFNQLLATMQLDSRSLLRIIGDELCDRGQNDYFTLKILEKLHQHHVPYIIIPSNHSMEALEVHERGKEFISTKQGTEALEVYEKGNDFTPRVLLREHSCSMLHLQILIQKGLVKRSEVSDMMDSVYKPALQAISYSLDEDNNCISIYSHAPIGLGNIKDFAKQLQVVYNDTTIKNLAETIDRINEKFQNEYVQMNKVHTLYTQNDIWDAYDAKISKFSRTPFVGLIWNRSYRWLERPRIWGGDSDRYNINFIHGHDSREPSIGHLFNLDNKLGKGLREHTGKYSGLYAYNPTRVARLLTENGENQFHLDLQASPELLKTALENNYPAALSSKDTDENTLVHFAAMNSRPLLEIILKYFSQDRRKFLEHLAVLNKFSRTPLHMAAIFNHSLVADILKYLPTDQYRIKALQVVNNEEETPFHLLFSREPSWGQLSEILDTITDKEMCLALLEMKNKSGVTVWDYVFTNDKLLDEMLAYFSSQKPQLLIYLEENFLLLNISRLNLYSLKVFLTHLPNDLYRKTTLMKVTKGENIVAEMSINFPNIECFRTVLSAFAYRPFGLRVLFQMSKDMIKLKGQNAFPGKIVAALFLEEINFDFVLGHIDQFRIRAKPYQDSFKLYNDFYESLNKAKTKFLNQVDLDQFVATYLYALSLIENQEVLHPQLSFLKKSILDPMFHKMDFVFNIDPPCGASEVSFFSKKHEKSTNRPIDRCYVV